MQPSLNICIRRKVQMRFTEYEEIRVFLRLWAEYPRLVVRKRGIGDEPEWV